MGGGRERLSQSSASPREAMGIRQFLLRGLEKVKGEWALIRCAFNLKRMHRLLGQAT